jgi:hypothetical protein
VGIELVGIQWWFNFHMSVSVKLTCLNHKNAKIRKENLNRIKVSVSQMERDHWEDQGIGRWTVLKWIER